ncbi:hypothetical protein MKW94_019284 [Papaver nudicaule]|uniref:Uncharacterized protein n=1 Tax=Papaver nudicaule TaxID=74823 RepID=A0AA41SJH2_PAPNU|nr:hypothetical protein [Papaver nudicaule]
MWVSVSKSAGNLFFSLTGLILFFVLLHLVKLSKALADAETTITLNPEWDKGYFRKGCVLEAMERYDDAIAAFQIALQYNSQSAEVSRKIKRLGQLAKDKKRVQELESIRSNIDMGKQLEALKKELVTDEDSKEIFSFVVETMEMTVKSWHETDKVDARVYYLLDKEKTDTEKYAPVVNIDKAFESPNTHGSCIPFLRQYAEDSFARGACLVVPKNIISYPQFADYLYPKGIRSSPFKHMRICICTFNPLILYFGFYVVIWLLWCLELVVMYSC